MAHRYRDLCDLRPFDPDNFKLVTVEQVCAAGTEIPAMTVPAECLNEDGRVSRSKLDRWVERFIRPHATGNRIPMAIWALTAYQRYGDPWMIEAARCLIAVEHDDVLRAVAGDAMTLAGAAIVFSGRHIDP